MYFVPDTIQFFKELAANNHKEWFDDNRKRYEEVVKKPFYSLVRDVIREVSHFEPNTEPEVKNSVFRINRDIRFSKDKSPYKLHVAAVVGEGGRKALERPGLYFHLGIGESFIGGGAYELSKPSLDRARHYLANHSSEARKILSEDSFQKTYGELRGEENKILPSELKEAGNDFPLIYKKQFYYMDMIDDENFMTRPDLLKVIMDHYHAGRPWNQFIRKALQ